jgi:serine-type D-Ala-D-Ala carboxypeptidase/endopeptidase (penicillin-binding protein 4)
MLKSLSGGPTPGIRRWLVAGLVVVAGVCAPAEANRRQGGASLEARVQAALSDAKLGEAAVGVSVVDLDSGRELVSIGLGAEGGRQYIPASNMKLLTSGAAVSVLGPDFEFRTEIVRDGDRLIVRGSGDPGLGDPELLSKMQLSVEQMLDKLALSIKDAGVAGVREVVVDDRVFDREFVHRDWPPEQLFRAYCAEVSGVNFHGNVLNVFVRPGRGAGSEPVARTEPRAPWIVLEERAKTVSQGATELGLERLRQPFTFRLTGNVRTPLDFPAQVTVRDPATMFGRLLADAVMRAGISATPGVPPPARLVDPAEQLGEGPVVAAVRTPISVALTRCNQDSDNLYAESLLKAAGHAVTGQPGSWGNGTAVVRMQVKDRIGGEFAASLVAADGSGLSRSNRVTPRTLTRWLEAMGKDQRVGPAFIESLPKIGEGTLERRFRAKKPDNEVRGKSGFIRQVRSLSGYVTDTSSGRRIAFSVLVNQIPPGADTRAKEFHERVVLLIDDWLTDRAASPSGKRERVPAEKVGG